MLAPLPHHTPDGTTAALPPGSPHPIAAGDAPQLTAAWPASRAGFAAAVAPAPVPAPYWVCRNTALADALGLAASWLDSDDALQHLSGNGLPAGAQPVATVYSGHQFGNWAGQLGDGRALLLGQMHTPLGVQELQLKGAGQTPFSRMGDGRAVLRSSIREFLCSEAMHGLGLPTTRALSVTGSPLRVRRETVETAAVVARVAPSFLRFGHFEHFSYNGQHGELRELADHVIDTFYPACRDAVGGQPAQPYAALLHTVTTHTAHLMAQWQAVGFCHGVMNTDNMSIIGLTLDYGPFQFLDGFNPDHICNHTDTSGRYAYNRQPQIAYWNLFCLGQALLPLLSDADEALAALEPYKTLFPAALTARMAAKLGLPADHPHARTLTDRTLQLLASERVDYTLFWRRLSLWVQAAQAAPDAAATHARLAALQDLFIDRSVFDTWLTLYSEQTIQSNIATEANLMLKTNPKYVLRNHLAQTAIAQAQTGDMAMVHSLLAVLAAPFDEHPAHEAWAGLPPDWAANIEISCSS